MLRLLTLLTLSSLLAACPRARSANAEAPTAPDAGVKTLPTGVITVTPAGQEPIRLQVELALTDPDRIRGMMHRPSLEDGHGMLFLFDETRVQSFWMKNTLISLDMIFIDETGEVVGIVHEAAPLTTTSRFVARPSRSVLEVPGGWSRANGVEAGAKVRDEAMPAGATVTPR